jgi:hypothetical protein
MVTIFPRDITHIVTLVLLLAVGYAGNATAQVPTKTIVIYNNSASETIYPMLQAPQQSVPTNPDIWLQGYFAVTHTTTQTFNTTNTYEVFINKDHGIAPGKYVSITVPFYTQLKQPGPDGPGATADEYIDWWNAMRLYLFDSHTAATNAYNYYTGGVAPVVAPVIGAVAPTCINQNMVTCHDPINITAYTVNPPFNIPFQLVEYTFANYGGDPPTLQGSQPVPPYTNQYRVGFDNSSIDSVYLPVAVAPLHNDVYGYLGTVKTVNNFRSLLNAFIANEQWPTYFPAYFPGGSAPAPYSTTPPPGAYPDGAYPGAVAVGTFNMFTETYRTNQDGSRFIPSPPLVTSNLPDTPSVTPGIAVSNMIQLWKQCSPANSATCKAITDIQTALADAGCPNPLYNPGMIPATQLDLVYGWVNSGCTGDFRPQIPPTPAQEKTFEDFLELQYNYQNVRSKFIFNPWTQLIRNTLASNAYAFSVDDSVGFVLLDGDGLIITVGGATNLPCPRPLTGSPPPPTCPKP